MVPEENTTIADPKEIRRDLEYMTARWHELSTPAIMEIRAFKEGAQPQTAKFSPDWIDDAVDWCESMNDLGFNIYAVRNPIRQDVTGSAKDDDILAAFFLWADCDDNEAAGNVKRFDGPKYSAAVTTGKTPTTRVHVYWQLEKPCEDLAQWRDMQVRIAAHFNSDKAVINPSRIMRVGGTVSYPFQKKREKGYVKEVCTIRTDYPDHRAPVTLEQMGRVFAATKSATAPTIDTGPAPLDRERTRIQALSGQDWHNAVIRLVASYVSKGLSDDEIHGLTAPLTLPGYTVDQTRREVQTAIDGARAKGWTPEPSPASTMMQAEVKAEQAWPTPFSQFNELALPRREWVYGTSYIRNYVSVIAAAGGIGKTSLGIVEALSICTGKPLMKEAVKETCKVWVINLEDPRVEMEMRTLAAMKHYGLSESDVAGNLFLDGEDDIEMTMAAEGRDGLHKNEALLAHMKDKITEYGIGVVIIDPFVSTHLVNENSNASIQAVAAMFRDLARSTGCAICLVHHTRKGNGDDATVDSVRGAGSLIGAARSARVVNRVTKEDAERLGVTPKEATGIFRVDDGKANLAPPAEEAVYRRMIGVELANGEWVGVATPFQLPDEWSGMSEEVINEILRQIDSGPAREDGSEEYYSARPQDKVRWVGKVIIDYPFARAEDFKTEGQAKAIIRQWLKSGLLEEVEYYSAAQRKDRKGVASTGRVGVQK